MKDKAGNKITVKEFFQRWKKGIDNITPIQKLENDVRGTMITLLGYIFAMGAVIWKFNTIGLLAIGLILIFLGSIVTTGLKWIALRQQLKFIKNLDYESDDSPAISEESASMDKAVSSGDAKEVKDENK